MKIRVNGGEAVESRRTEGAITGEMLNVTCAYENTRDATVPTGADIPFGAAMLTLPLFGLAMYLIIKRRRREEQ